MNNAITIIPNQTNDSKEISIQSDLQLAKDNIKSVLEKLVPAFEDLVDISRQSQNDKYFTALSGLAKTIIEGNKELIHLSKTDKEIEKISIDNENKKIPADGDVTNINQLYVSSDEVLQMIMDKRKKDNK